MLPLDILRLIASWLTVDDYICFIRSICQRVPYTVTERVSFETSLRVPWYVKIVRVSADRPQLGRLSASVKKIHLPLFCWDDTPQGELPAQTTQLTLTMLAYPSLVGRPEWTPQGLVSRSESSLTDYNWALPHWPCLTEGLTELNLQYMPQFGSVDLPSTLQSLSLQTLQATLTRDSILVGSRRAASRHIVLPVALRSLTLCTVVALTDIPSFIEHLCIDGHIAWLGPTLQRQCRDGQCPLDPSKLTLKRLEIPNMFDEIVGEWPSSLEWLTIGSRAGNELPPVKQLKLMDPFRMWPHSVLDIPAGVEVLRLSGYPEEETYCEVTGGPDLRELHLESDEAWGVTDMYTDNKCEVFVNGMRRSSIGYKRDPS